MTLRSLKQIVTRASAALLLAVIAGVPASAQTLQMTESNATVLRGGSYANKNFAGEAKLSTRASSDQSYVRRVVLKFDTQNPIPQNANVSSAILTLTVAGGNAETRKLSLYRVANSFEELQSTWNRRNSATSWSRAGGDLAEVYATDSVTASVGSQVSFDVTALVQAAVSGKFGSSRYTRVALVDTGASSRNSYKEYFSDEAGDINVRPRLSVTLGSGTAPAPAPAPAPVTEPEPDPQPSTGSTLKVVDWNIHHGVGMDGVYNIDRLATALVKTGAQVISLNEVERYTGWGNEDQPARFAALLKAKTGKTWYYNFASRHGSTNGQGNLLLTTYPIQGHADYLLSYGRSVAQIRIIVNGRAINIFSTHLDDGSSTRRHTQMTELTRWMAQFPEQRIATGDFNAWPGAGEITVMTSGHKDVWAEAMRLGTAVAYAGNTAGNTRNSRIDYVFLSRSAAQTVIKGSQVFDMRTSSGVMLSDHRPVMGIFEIR